MSTHNTIVICSDQHHSGFLGYRGHKYVQTPNLDALAEQGTSFNRAYCNSPLCTPSRMSFITGKYVHQTGSWFNGVPLSENEHTWPARLSGAGVETTMLGKMHFSGSYQSGGFDQYKILDRQGAFSPYPRTSPLPSRLIGYVRDTKRLHLKRAGVRKPLVTGGSDIANDAIGAYDHDRHVTLWAKDFLRNKRGEQAPWVLYLGYLFPHWPYTCPEKYFNMYYPDNIEMPFDCVMPENPGLHPAIREFQRSCNFIDITQEDIRRTIAAYCGMITCMDDMIGEVLESLKELGMYDDTTIVYMSDHGENCGEHGLFYKQCAYEASVAVPLIVKGPDVASGHVVDTPVSLVDLYPTILGRYGLPVEDDCPGKSWAPLLEGQEIDDSGYIFSEYHGNFFRNSWYMLLQGDLKYIYYVNGKPSLYDLRTDPQELCDLADDPAYANKLAEFEKHLHSMINPEEVDLQSKRDLGLYTSEGVDLTQTLTVSQMEEAMKSGSIPQKGEWDPYTYDDFMNEH